MGPPGVISNPDWMSSSGPSELDCNSKLATLISRLLSHARVGESEREKPQPELVPLASALLQCRLTWDHAIGFGRSVDPVWIMLLFVYVRQAEGPDLSLASLSDLSVVGPRTVVVRWTTALVSAGTLELAGECSSGTDTVVRLSSHGLHKIENWLRAISAELARLL
jgi:hypothetical protein